jgi:hypothetical protein
MRYGHAFIYVLLGVHKIENGQYTIAMALTVGVAARIGALVVALTIVTFA